MPRGGARPGAGAKKKAVAPPVGDKNFCARILEIVHGKRPHPADDCRCEGCDWWDLYWAKDNDARIRLRVWLYDKRDGKAIQTVNHVHDKPIELHIVDRAEELKKARQRAASAKK